MGMPVLIPTALASYVLAMMHASWLDKIHTGEPISSGRRTSSHEAKKQSASMWAMALGQFGSLEEGIRESWCTLVHQ